MTFLNKFFTDSVRLMYQSIPGLTIPPGNFFDGQIPHLPGQKKRVQNPHPRAYKMS